MVYGITTGCNSLRELCGGIVSYGDKISHCKFDYSPKRSTISDANKRRDCIVFEDIYSDLAIFHSKYRFNASNLRVIVLYVYMK